VISRLRVSWDATPSVFVSRGGHVIVQFRKSSETDWQSVPPLEGTATQVWITPVDDAIAYDVRVAFENSISARSSWVQIAHTVVGKTQPPADVTGFQVSGTRLTWNPVTDADLWGYRLRLQPGSSQSWGDAIWLHGQGTAQQDVVTTPPFTLPIAIVGQATLMVKAVDLSGNESQNPATLVVNLTGPAIANVVQSFDRKAAGFPGTQTNCAVDGSGNLAANSTTLMWSSDDRASMWKADSTQLMWAAAAFAQLQYEDRIITNGARAGSTLTLTATVQGDPWKIEYRENSTKAMWSADASSLMWNASSRDADVGHADLPHLARPGDGVPRLDVRLPHHRRPGADAGKDHRAHRDARCARHHRDARQRGDLLGRHAPRADEELRHGEERAPHGRQRRRHGGEREAGRHAGDRAARQDATTAPAPR
jgi:hypothetical protein